MSLVLLALVDCAPARRTAPAIARPAPTSAAPQAPLAKGPPPPPPTPSSTAGEPTATEAPDARPEESVEALLQKMTLEEKVGQLLMVGFTGPEVDAEARALLSPPGVGGVCLFKRNILGAAQVTQLNAALRALAANGIPPLLALDQEGGNVVRVQEQVPVLPGNMALGATGSVKLAYAAGRAQARALRRLGFNTNLAPVLDVNLNPHNPVIGIRSFGDSPEAVAKLGEAFVKGQQEANLITVAKHFPGHGNTDADSHRALPLMNESRTELLEELLPFRRTIAAGLDGLMTAHVAVPKVSGDDLPATMSPALLDGLLRRTLRYEGLVLTDELEMDAISRRFGVAEAAVSAVIAGADMVLVPWRPQRKAEARSALIRAVRSERISQTRLDASVRRILSLKMKRGLFAPEASDLSGLPEEDWDQVPNQIARAAVTLLRVDKDHFPIPRRTKLAVLTSEKAFADSLRARFRGSETWVVPAYPKVLEREAQRHRAQAMAAKAEQVVLGITNSHQLDLVDAAASSGRPVTVVVLGLPYLAEEVPAAGTVLAVYSYRATAARAAADALAGRAGTPGHLPVSLRHLPRGFGLSTR